MNESTFRFNPEGIVMGQSCIPEGVIKPEINGDLELGDMILLKPTYFEKQKTAEFSRV